MTMNNIATKGSIDYFTPNGQCFSWDQNILWINALSEGTIAAVCLSIPLITFFSLRRHKTSSLFKIAAVFSPFLLFCGITHMLSVIVLWIPAYQIEGTVKALTAGIALTTSLLLLPLIRRIPPPSEQQPETP